MNKYKFRSYSKKYPKLFEKEKQRLRKFLPNIVKIEHIGSTSVPNLKGKGIIDILIAIEKNNLNKVKEKLLEKGYIIMPHAGNKSRISFKKNYGILRNRRVHIHLTFLNSKTWKETLKFKNNLLKNLELRKQYSEIKKQAVKKAQGKGQVYRDLKNNFMKKYSK